MRAPAASVLIPTRGRPGHLTACLGCLAAQDAESGPFEVLVSLDGPDEASRRAAEAFAGALDITVVQGPRRGVAEARNRAIGVARGALLIMLNDDVRPGSGLVKSHLRAHAERPGRGPAMVLGYSPFVVPEGETLFDRLVRESSMVFFYDRMIDEAGAALGERDRDWGFRHAWTLNLSVSRAAAVEVGGFRPALANCCYEDVEFGWRLSELLAAPVLFRPDAAAPHEHRFTPGAYLEREWRLGYSAHGFAHAAPECAGAVFRRDLRRPDEVEAVRSAGPGAGEESAVLRAFCGLAGRPAAEAGTGEAGRATVRRLYEEHLPLKRSAWRRGFLAACDGERAEGLFHLSDGLAGEPGLAAAGVW